MFIRKRADILVDAKEVRRIVLLFDLDQTIVIVAIGGPDTVLSLFHHEIDVCATQVVGMYGVPFFNATATPTVV